MRARWRTLAAVLTLGTGTSAGGDSPMDRAGWWVEHFGVIEPHERPELQRAWSIFQRVLAAADKNGKRFPRLVVLRERRGPFALALPDGTVLLTPDAVELCYKDVPRSVGEARLAFLLGHELAHLARDDFWHAFAPTAKRAGAEPVERTRDKERQADAYGVLYLVMAGYSPDSVLRDGSSFLERWEQAVGAHALRAGGTHPSARERARDIRANLRAMEEKMELFRSGVRLMQLERYGDALLFLHPFQEAFPSREVFNDLGVCNLQLYLRAVVACDAEEALRFRLPARLDPSSRLRRVNPRGARTPCAEHSRRHLEEAERRLEHAVAADPGYARASVNLASVRILKGDHARALAAAEDALKAEPGSVEARSVKAIAMYLYDAKDLAGRALEILRDLRAQRPADRDVAYNLAALLDELERGAAARKAWADFLEMEPRGWFADRAYRRLQREPPPAPSRPEARVESSIPLGELQGRGEQALKALRAHSFDLGGVAATVYRGDRASAIEIEGWIEVVEEDIPPQPLAQIVAAYGPPRRDVEGAGARTLVYDGLAFDVVNGHAVRRVSFAVTH
jgi:tetratricopeptide (TPR) repeat protein